MAWPCWFFTNRSTNLLPNQFFWMLYKQWFSTLKSMTLSFLEEKNGLIMPITVSSAFLPRNARGYTGALLHVKCVICQYALSLLPWKRDLCRSSRWLFHLQIHGQAGLSEHMWHTIFLISVFFASHAGFPVPKSEAIHGGDPWIPEPVSELKEIPPDCSSGKDNFLDTCPVWC